MSSKVYLLLTISLIITSCGGGGGGSGTNTGERDTRTEEMIALGKLIFEDESLSANGNQSCASCHDASSGFADPPVEGTGGKLISVSDGSPDGAVGTRNTPSSAYAGFSPRFGTASFAGQTVYVGGQFLDGRRNTLEEQAKDPFLNPVEMANANAQDVINKIRAASYADRFIALFGSNVFDNVNDAFNKVAETIAAFERSSEMNKFNSKFDCYLRDSSIYPLSTAEQAGLEAFNSPAARCHECHLLDPQPSTGKVLLTNFMYFNIGVPRNMDIPANANSSFNDRGLGGRAGISSTHDFKFKTPSLRNVAVTAPYMHNGIFDTLLEVVQFYNTLEKIDAEFINNVAGEVDVEFSQADESNIVAFLNTLTDGTGVGICF